MHRCIVGGMTILFLVCSAKADADKDDAIARDVVERLFKAVLARDVEGLMKLIDVPWCHDAREIIMDKEKLREEFSKAFKRERDSSKDKVHIRMIATLAKFREAKKAPPTRGASLGEVLGKNHRVVFIEVEHDGRFQPVWIGVRLEKGKGKVVGMVD